MEQPLSSRSRTLRSFQGSPCLRLRAPLSSTGGRGGAARLEPVAQMASPCPGPSRQTARHRKHRQGLCPARETLSVCPHSQGQKKESTASQLSLRTAVTPVPRDRGPAPPPVPDASTTSTHRSGSQCTLRLHSAPGRSSASAPRSRWLLCRGSLKGCPTRSHSGLPGHCL